MVCREESCHFKEPLFGALMSKPYRAFLERLSRWGMAVGNMRQWEKRIQASKADEK